MNDLIKIIGNVAPYIASALGVPGLAVGAIATLSKVIFGKENASEEEILNTLNNASPDILLKIKQADYDYKIKVQQEEINKFKAEADDRANARAREIATQSSIQNELDKINRNLAYLVVVGFFSIAGSLIFTQMTDAAEKVLIFMFGNVTTLAGMVISYYFGSSSGSADKSGMIEKIMLSLKHKISADEEDDE
jgi:hypothetical protein